MLVLAAGAAFGAEHLGGVRVNARDASALRRLDPCRVDGAILADRYALALESVYTRDIYVYELRKAGRWKAMGAARFCATMAKLYAKHEGRLSPGDARSALNAPSVHHALLDAMTAAERDARRFSPEPALLDRVVGRE